MRSREVDRQEAQDVSIIVVSYNSEPYLERSLGSVSDGESELIVVDNASQDASAEVVRRRFPAARLVELDANRGFGAACNEGMRHASGKYFLLMNPDAWPVGDGVGSLVRFAAERPRVGVAGPALRTPDGRPQRSAYGYPTAFWRGTAAVTSQPRTRIGTPHRSYFLVGTVLLLRRAAVEEVGGFDERFFMFNEEIDLCRRMQLAGWRVELCPQATFEHVGGASTRDVWPEMYREQLRGHLLFIAKHRGLRQAELARRVLLVTTNIRARTGDDAARQAAAWLASGNAARLVGD